MNKQYINPDPIPPILKEVILSQTQTQSQMNQNNGITNYVLDKAVPSSSMIPADQALAGVENSCKCGKYDLAAAALIEIAKIAPDLAAAALGKLAPGHPGLVKAFTTATFPYAPTSEYSAPRSQQPSFLYADQGSCATNMMGVNRVERGVKNISGTYTTPALRFGVHLFSGNGLLLGASPQAIQAVIDSVLGTAPAYTAFFPPVNIPFELLNALLFIYNVCPAIKVTVASPNGIKVIKATITGSNNLQYDSWDLIYWQNPQDFNSNIITIPANELSLGKESILMISHPELVTMSIATTFDLG